MPRRTTPEELAEELRELTVALKRHARADGDAGAPPYPQLAVLKRLELEGPATSADLARGETMTPQSMGAIVAALETAGYATRRDDTSHGRRRLVSITSAGRRVLIANRTARLHRMATIIGERFDADERATLAAAFALLRRSFLS